VVCNSTLHSTLNAVFSAWGRRAPTRSSGWLIRFKPWKAITQKALVGRAVVCVQPGVAAGVLLRAHPAHEVPRARGRRHPHFACQGKISIHEKCMLKHEYADNDDDNADDNDNSNNSNNSNSGSSSSR
jgi:hypothetical protein